MRAYKIVPWGEVRAVGLSKKAQERLVWIDWYHIHEKKVRLTLRHFALSPDVFYRWLKRFKDKGILARVSHFFVIASDQRERGNLFWDCFVINTPRNDGR